MTLPYKFTCKKGSQNLVRENVLKMSLDELKLNYSNELLNATLEFASTEKSQKLDPRSSKAKNILISWFIKNLKHPYPTRKEKDMLRKATDLTHKQLYYWFANMRKRHWKPIVNGEQPKSYIDLVLKYSS